MRSFNKQHQIVFGSKCFGLFNFVKAIGKWSMADVFVVGVFIAYLSTKSNEAISAELYEGFYYFTGYCLISLAAIQAMKISVAEEPDS